MKILITGGAGYIGSHVVKLLGETTDHEIVILDNLSTGNRKSILFGRFIEADLANFSEIETIMKIEQFDIVMHFAASIVVPESVENPIKYYMNNTINTTNLIRCAIDNHVKSFIFSSTAAVYGDSTMTKVNEDSALNTINPYGMSKLMSEIILRDNGKAHPNFKYVILRYFNVAGASLDNQIGHTFPNATHLIKAAAECAVGKKSQMFIFGTDYPTYDGTCIRDYIHIEDLASAHISALEYLIHGGKSDAFNCGYGQGYSVREVIKTMQTISGVDFNVETMPRREGDLVELIADNQKILTNLSWHPRFNDLNLICDTALKWEQKLLEENE